MQTRNGNMKFYTSILVSETLSVECELQVIYVALPYGLSVAVYLSSSYKCFHLLQLFSSGSCSWYLCHLGFLLLFKYPPWYIHNFTHCPMRDYNTDVNPDIHCLQGLFWTLGRSLHGSLTVIVHVCTSSITLIVPRFSFSLTPLGDGWRERWMDIMKGRLP